MDASPRPEPAPPWLQAPFALVAVAATLGLWLQRAVQPGLWPGVLLSGGGLGLWLLHGGRIEPARGRLAALGLLLAVLGLAAVYQHNCTPTTEDFGIAALATQTGSPIQLRGVVCEEPIQLPEQPYEPLRSQQRGASIRTSLAVQQRKDALDWRPAHGRVRLFATGALTDWHVGDTVEVLGRLQALPTPGNPGEADPGALQREHKIGALLYARDAPASITLLERGWVWTPAGWIAQLRALAHQQLTDWLPQQQLALALALLLGEDHMLEQAAWERYQRTGVLHVLGISGQHLVILAGFLWLGLRVLAVPQRHGVVLVTLILLVYALVSGGRPPVLRAALMVAAFALAMLLRRPAAPGNTFALAWLLIAALNPPDLLQTGCQLSFLAVAVLLWGVAPLLHEWQKEKEPLDVLVDETRPLWLRGLRWLGWQLAQAYFATLVVGLVLAPLLAARYHLVAPVGLLLGPAAVLLTTVALLAGFALLLTGWWCPPLAQLAAWVTSWSLGGCDALVSWGETWPGAYWYVPSVPESWLALCYLGVLGGLWVPWLRQRWPWLLMTLLLWVCVGLALPWLTPRERGWRCTFLAVGHGGCVVIETPEERTILYDVGSLTGPEVTARQIAPYLWERGIRRIDEVILSHADLDHFNGLADLLERFAVGQITCTPSFRQRAAPSVALTLGATERTGVPIRIVQRGARLTAGATEFLVLHPPEHGPVGKENVRSLVLLVRHQGHSMLLTGDLEGQGLTQVLQAPPMPVDVLMAPHHGSPSTNVPALAQWARPRLVVSSQAAPKRPELAGAVYLKQGIRYLTTWEHGAVTIHSSARGLSVDTYRTGQRLVLTERQ